MKLYGNVRLSSDGDTWVIQCEPHISMRIKQVFSQVDKGQHGSLKLSATATNSRDLEWFLSRYPMQVEDANILADRARAYDEQVERSHQILSGSYDLPNYDMVLPPRNYQKVAAALAINNNGLLCADDLGLGKTVTAITMLADKRSLPALVTVPAHLPLQWEREINRFLPNLRTHVLKKGSPYPLVNAEGELPDVLVTSYHKLRGWADHLGHEGNSEWAIQSIIYDECQELRRPDSLKYRAAHYLSQQATYRMGLSATPIYNYGGEFFSVMDAIKPGCLGSREEFIREWCVSSYGDKPRIKNPKSFGTYLRDAGLMVRRTRKDVARELPKLNQVIHQIESDPKALEDVEDAATELAKIIVSQNKGFEIMKASSELSNTLRQATGVAKAPYVAEFVRMLLEQDLPVLLFGWHREVYSIWASRLAEFNPAWYTGSESPVKKQREAQRFLDGETNLLILSLRSGSGLDGLQHRCSTVVFGELDWSPGVLEQCVGRPHRDGQRDPVFAYYLTATDGVDPIMIDILGLKRQQIRGVRDPHGGLVLPKTVDPDHIRKLAEAYLDRRA